MEHCMKCHRWEKLKLLGFTAVLATALLSSGALAYLGLAQFLGPIAALLVGIFLLNMPPAALALTWVSLAFWGAYAGLGMHWIAATLLAVPIIVAGSWSVLWQAGGALMEALSGRGKKV